MKELVIIRVARAHLHDLSENDVAEILTVCREAAGRVFRKLAWGAPKEVCTILSNWRDRMERLRMPEAIAPGYDGIVVANARVEPPADGPQYVFRFLKPLLDTFRAL